MGGIKAQAEIAAQAAEFLPVVEQPAVELEEEPLPVLAQPVCGGQGGAAGGPEGPLPLDAQLRLGQGILYALGVRSSFTRYSTTPKLMDCFT